MKKQVLSLLLLASIPYKVAAMATSPLTDLVHPLLTNLDNKTPDSLVAFFPRMHERLRGLPDDVRWRVIFDAYHSAQCFPAIDEIKLTKRTVAHIVHKHAYDFAIKYTTSEIATKLANSHKRNVEIAMNKSDTFTGSDINKFLGREQQKSIVQDLQHAEYARHVHTELPVIH
ncbi:MAG TPA: hypothetical protein VGW78_07145 [Candidatus Babeliales bacterium]|jgi:hypothetical protein|nr:hypothetical protein [Candidatus Babeliales bacterium]